MEEDNSHNSINQRDDSIISDESRKKDSTVRVLFKFYKLLSTKWRNKKKYEENKTDPNHNSKLQSKDGGSLHPHRGIEEIPEVCCFRYNVDGIDGDSPTTSPGGSSKCRSVDNCGFPFLSSPFSRSSSSRRSASPFSTRRASSRRSPSTRKSSLLYRSMSRNNSTELSGYYHPGASPALSRNASQKTTIPIMFSNSTGMPVKPPAVEKQLECTLEELCFGCTKNIKITRDAITSSGQLIQEEEVLTVEVKPGWKKGTKITFEGKGDDEVLPPGTQQADATFVISEKHHCLFSRDGDDLGLVLEIPLVKALTGGTITVPLLGGEKMDLSIDDDDEIIHHGYEKMIEGQGMTMMKDDHDEEGGARRGNLKLLFLVEFPTDLTVEQRSNVLSILEDCC